MHVIIVGGGTGGKCLAHGLRARHLGGVYERYRSRNEGVHGYRVGIDPILWVHPMLAGVGTTQDMIFTEELNTRLTLLDVQRLDSGVVLLSYGPS